MIIKKEQVGVGLIEVLVSLLLLSVAVLGFSILQMTSVKATDESLKRTQSMSVARELSESLRTHAGSIDKIQEVINDDTKAGDVTLSSCEQLLEPCSVEEIAKKDALSALKKVDDYGIQVGIETCTGTGTGTGTDPDPDPDFDTDTDTGVVEARLSTACIVISWNTTNPFTDASTRTDVVEGNVNCANENGVYYPNSDCIIVESY